MLDYYSSFFFHRLNRDRPRGSCRGRTEKANHLRRAKGNSDRDSLARCHLADLPLRHRRHAARAGFERDDPHRGGRFPKGLLGPHLARGPRSSDSSDSSDEGARSAKGAKSLPSELPFSFGERVVPGQRPHTTGSPRHRAGGGGVGPSFWGGASLPRGSRSFWVWVP